MGITRLGRIRQGAARMLPCAPSGALGRIHGAYHDVTGHGNWCWCRRYTGGCKTSQRGCGAQDAARRGLGFVIQPKDHPNE